MPSPTLDACRTTLAMLPPPVIVFNKSHSGSRLLAALLDAGGVALGAEVNESWDALPILGLVEDLVLRYYPDFAPLWDPAAPVDRPLQERVESAFRRHRAGLAPTRAWGWKLCETVYIVPVLDYLFPGARFIHLIRDGRDVAFSDHKGPDSPFWRKVYFNTDRIRTHRGLRLTAPAYRRQSPLYNAQHWVNSVTLGRAYGAMLRDRYHEIRYEDLCRDPASARPVLEAVGCPDPAGAIAAIQHQVRGQSVGKHRRQSRSSVRAVVQIQKPLLLELGYLTEDSEPASRRPWRSAAADALADRWRRRRAALMTRARRLVARTPGPVTASAGRSEPTPGLER